MKAKEHQDAVKLIRNRYEQQLADLREQLRAANARIADLEAAAADGLTDACAEHGTRSYTGYCPVQGCRNSAAADYASYQRNYADL